MKTVKGWKRTWLLVPLVMAAIAVIVLQVIPALAEEPAYDITEGVPDGITVGVTDTDSTDTTKIRFGGQEWYVAGYDEEGVYH